MHNDIKKSPQRWSLLVTVHHVLGGSEGLRMFGCLVLHGRNDWSTLLPVTVSHGLASANMFPPPSVFHSCL